jgi:hypothetical protein
MSEAKLTLVQAYEVEIDGKKLGRFFFDEEWHGMMRLRDISGNSIIVSKSPNLSFENILSGIFYKEISGQLVSASPDILSKILS